MVRIIFRFLRVAIAGCASVLLLGGCGWHHHPRKPKSYDREISDEDRDPTYRDDPQRADVEVRDER